MAWTEEQRQQYAPVDRKKYEQEYWDRPHNRARKRLNLRKWHRKNQARVLAKRRVRYAEKGNVHRDYQKEWYRKNRARILERNRRRVEAIRRLIDKQKAKPCADCGRRFPVVCMDFDHVRGKKFRSVSSMLSFKPSQVLAEIAKCVVVCANCHRIRTWIERKD